MSHWSRVERHWTAMAVASLASGVVEIVAVVEIEIDDYPVVVVVVVVVVGVVLRRLQIECYLY